MFLRWKVESSADLARGAKEITQTPCNAAHAWIFGGGSDVRAKLDFPFIPCATVVAVVGKMAALYTNQF